MGIKAPQELNAEAFKRMGAIFHNLNQIEFFIASALSTFFMDFSDPHSEKHFIFAEALFDENIFPTLENKRQMLIKVIKDLGLVAKKYGINFDKDNFLVFCTSVKKVQEIRNKLAHRHLVFFSDGKVGYSLKRSREELLHNIRTEVKTGIRKLVKIDLDHELKKSQVVLGEANKFLSDFLKQFQEVLLVQQKNDS